MISLLERFARSVPYRRYEGTVVAIRPPRSSDWIEWAQLRAESRQFLEPWEPQWPRDALSKDLFRRRLARYVRDAREDEGYAFLVFRREDEALLGGINVSNVARGIRMSCSLGYWIGERYARQGYMTEAARLVLDFTFGELRLHRVEAGCVPVNDASTALLRKLGFQEEGYARKYLNINGRWHDHRLFALLATDPRG